MELRIEKPRPKASSSTETNIEYNNRFWLSVKTATLPWRSRVDSWLMNSGNYAFLALVFLSIALITAIFGSPTSIPAQSFAALTLPALVGFVCTLLFVPFVVHRHFNAQRYTWWKKQAKNNSLTYEDYLEADKQQFNFKAYLFSLVPLMAKNKTLTVAIMLAIALSAFLVVGIGLFLAGVPFYTQLLQPFVDLMAAVFSPLMSVETVHIVAPIIASLIPLIIVDAIRRIVEVVDDAHEHAVHEDYGVDGSEYSPKYHVYVAADKALFYTNKKAPVFTAPELTIDTTDLAKPANNHDLKVGSLVVAVDRGITKLMKVLGIDNNKQQVCLLPINSKGNPPGKVSSDTKWLPISAISQDLIVVKYKGNYDSSKKLSAGDYVIVDKQDHSSYMQKQTTIDVWKAEHGGIENSFVENGLIVGMTSTQGRIDGRLSRLINRETGMQLSIDSLIPLEESDNAPYKVSSFKQESSNGLGS
jgi:hypothetical protein